MAKKLKIDELATDMYLNMYLNKLKLNMINCDVSISFDCCLYFVYPVVIQINRYDIMNLYKCK